MASKDDGVKDYLSGFKVASIEKRVEKAQIIEDIEGDEGSSSDEESSQKQSQGEDNEMFQKLLKDLREKDKAN